MATVRRDGYPLPSAGDTACLSCECPDTSPGCCPLSFEDFPLCRQGEAHPSSEPAAPPGASFLPVFSFQLHIKPPLAPGANSWKEPQNSREGEPPPLSHALRRQAHYALLPCAPRLLRLCMFAALSLAGSVAPVISHKGDAPRRRIPGWEGPDWRRGAQRESVPAARPSEAGQRGPVPGKDRASCQSGGAPALRPGAVVCLGCWGDRKGQGFPGLQEEVQSGFY